MSTALTLPPPLSLSFLARCFRFVPFSLSLSLSLFVSFNPFFVSLALLLFLSWFRPFLYSFFLLSSLGSIIFLSSLFRFTIVVCPSSFLYFIYATIVSLLVLRDALIFQIYGHTHAVTVSNWIIIITVIGTELANGRRTQQRDSRFYRDNDRIYIYYIHRW